MVSSPLSTLLAQGFRVLAFREGMWGEAARLRDLVQTADKAQEVGELETQSGTGGREPQETPNGEQEECGGTL